MSAVVREVAAYVMDCEECGIRQDANSPEDAAERCHYHNRRYHPPEPTP